MFSSDLEEEVRKGFLSAVFAFSAIMEKPLISIVKRRPKIKKVADIAPDQNL